MTFSTKCTVNVFLQIIATSSDPNNTDSDFTYDPFEGFKIRNVDSWEMKGQHQCEGTWPKSSFISRSGQFKIKIQGTPNYYVTLMVL